MCRPPSSSLSAFNLEFCSVLSRFSNNCIVMGDFNVDICSDYRFSSVCDLVDKFSAEGYNSLIDIPTRVTRNSSTCIDHIYVKTLLPNKSGVTKTSVSDHYPIFCCLPNINNVLKSIEHNYFSDNSKNSLNVLKTYFSRSLVSFIALDNLDIDNKFKIFLI